MDNELLKLLYSVEFFGEGLSSVVALLKTNLYQGVVDWYEKYTKNQIEGHWAECAELLHYLYIHENVDYCDAQYFSTIRTVLCDRYGIEKEFVFSFLSDYRKLLYN